jgi:LemA protein
MKALARAVAVMIGLALTVWVWTLFGAADLRSMHSEVDDLWVQLLESCQHRAEVAVPALDVIAAGGVFDRAMLDHVRARAVAAGGKTDPAILEDPEKFAAFAKTQQELSNALYAVRLTFDRHPAFKAKPALKRADEQLRDVDNAVFSQMTIYSRQARQYDRALSRFPGTVVGPKEGFKPRPVLETPKAQGAAQ